MGTPWDQAAEGYLREWVPRFVPYHLDLVRELSLEPGERVLVTSAGPGSEVLAVARVVGETGFVRATDQSEQMVQICERQIRAAGFSDFVKCEVADASDARLGPWDAIVCAFGFWQFQDRVGVLKAWREALAPNGKIGLITSGPPDPDDAFDWLNQCLRDLEPGYAPPRARILAHRDAMSELFAAADLTLVRHTVVRHTLSFRSAEAFIDAMRESCTWRRICEDLGEERVNMVARRFYARVGGPDAPLTFRPPSTIAIAARSGAEVRLDGRPPVSVP